MIGFVTVGTRDLSRAGRFYDALLGGVGARRWMESDQFIAWARAPLGEAVEPAFGVTLPHDGNPATVGNGVMVAWVVDSREKVDSLLQHALELGGTHASGPREGNFYGAFFRDPDGNKLGVYCMAPAP